MADGTQAQTQPPETSGNGGMIELPVIKEIAAVYGMGAAAFCFTFRSVAMPQPHTEAEFVSCILVAKEHGLNPLTKEIYFMRDRHGKIQAIVGVDGWIKKCNSHPQFDGIEFDEKLADDGRPSNTTCIIYRKDRNRPIKVTEHYSECVQPQRNGKDGAWQTHPHRMLRHRSLTQGARIAFGFAGVMDRDEFNEWMMRDVTPGEPTSVPRRQSQAALTRSTAPAFDIGDIPDAEPAPVATSVQSAAPVAMAAKPAKPEPSPVATPQDDEEAMIRRIERALVVEPQHAEEIRAAHYDDIKLMSEEGRQRVLTMFDAVFLTQV